MTYSHLKKATPPNLPPKSNLRVTVDKARLNDLERLYDAVHNWRYGLVDKQTKGNVGSLSAVYPAIYRLATTFDEVERLEKWRRRYD